MLRRYGINVFEFDIQTFLELAEYAMEKEREEEIRAEYNAVFPFMQMGYFKTMSFTRYHELRTGKNIDTRPAWQIIAEIDEIHKKSKEK